MRVSIVTSYFNRKKLLINTLKSIVKTKHNDFEFIIVDDASSEENRIEDLIQEFPFIKLVRIEPEDKWYCNPCVPFNVGFKHVTGDIVIIQNPECLHTTDIISYVNNNLKETDYFSFACYSINESKTNNISENTDSFDSYENLITNNRGAGFDGDDSWYNHSVFRNKGYHFTSAIHTRKLKELNGFDERYANGHGYDDDEFLHRVKKICDFLIIDNPFVLHQHHYNLEKPKLTSPIIPTVNNRELFQNHTSNEKTIKVN
jgi:glycosyltransferase involved in cell wall biosynthesis